MRFITHLSTHTSKFLLESFVLQHISILKCFSYDFLKVGHVSRRSLIGRLTQKWSRKARSKCCLFRTVLNAWNSHFSEKLFLHGRLTPRITILAFTVELCLLLTIYFSFAFIVNVHHSDKQSSFSVVFIQHETHFYIA